MWPTRYSESHISTLARAQSPYHRLLLSYYGGEMVHTSQVAYYIIHAYFKSDKFQGLILIWLHIGRTISLRLPTLPRYPCLSDHVVVIYKIKRMERRGSDTCMHAGDRDLVSDPKLFRRKSVPAFFDGEDTVFLRHAGDVPAALPNYISKPGECAGLFR